MPSVEDDLSADPSCTVAPGKEATQVYEQFHPPGTLEQYLSKVSHTPTHRTLS